MTEAPMDGAFDTSGLLTFSDPMDEERETPSAEGRPARRAAPSLADRLRALEAFSAA